MKQTLLITLLAIIFVSSAFAQSQTQQPPSDPAPTIEPKEYLCYQDYFAETGDPNWDLALLFLRIKKSGRMDAPFDCTLGHTAGGFGVPSIAETVSCSTWIDGDQRLVYEAEDLELDMHIDVSTLVVMPADPDDDDEHAKGPTEFYASVGSIKMNDLKKKYYELVKHKFRCVEAKGDVLNTRLWKM